MERDKFLGDDFTLQVIAAGAQALQDTVKAGVPVFYRDTRQNIDVVEQPDGRKFEIRFLPSQPRDRNYEVLRELGKPAA